MKKFRIVVVLAALMAFFVATTAFAGPAYNAAFTTSVTYQNVGSASADIVFNFYPENSGTAISINRTLPTGAGASIFVGGLAEIAAGFKGSAVMSSSQPVVATLVQISSDPDVKNRPLSNGFSEGSSRVLLATVLKNKFNATSRFSVQNASGGAVDLTISFYNAENTAAPAIMVTHNNLPVGAAKYFDMGTLTQITASSFNGSAVIEAKAAGTNTPAPVVASVLELSTNAGGASAFEGVPSGAMTVYMASALCNAFGGQNSAYAIQNTGAVAATVQVKFSSGNTENVTVQPGAKASVQGCAAGNPAGFSGSATIESTQDIVVIGKVFGLGLSTAFVGEPDGAAKLALPYVRWTNTQWTTGQRQRAFIAVQNVGGSALAAGSVTLKYIDKDGNVVGTHALGSMAAGAKLNSNASLATGNAAALAEFGYVGGFGGGVIVEGPAGSKLVAVVRVQSSTGGSSVVGEDYNGIQIP